MRKLKVEVVYTLNETTYTTIFSCDHASVTMRDHATVVAFRNGVDDKGRLVTAVLYRRAESVTKYFEDDSKAGLGKPSLPDLLAHDLT